MKCEICHKAEAQTAVVTRTDGVERELYVCEACAEQLRTEKKTPSRKGEHPQVSIVDGTKANPPPFVEELVKATLGFMKGVAEAKENERQICPVCKTKWDQIKDSGRMGCPACWKAFAKHIRGEFLASQFGLSHQGTAPAVEKLTDTGSVRKIVERDLKAAIAREDYRLAAELKHKLDALRNGEESAS